MKAFTRKKKESSTSEMRWITGSLYQRHNKVRLLESNNKPDKRQKVISKQC